MAEKVYTTDAFLIGSRDSGESSRIYYLFTRDLGLVHAYARSVREGKGKLRYHLEGGVLITVSLIRGREYWRIVGADSSLGTQENFYHRRAYAKVFDLLSRFLGVETGSANLFDELASSYRETLKLKWPSTEADRLKELLSLRTLDHLGYVGETDGANYSDSGKVILAINNALNVSHL